MKSEPVQVLKQAKLKITPARLAVLDLFSDGCDPLNADDIYSKVKRKKINLVTIYRTLSSLEMSGVLKKVDLRKASAYYEMTDHHHHHIICTNCGTIERFDVCVIGDMSKKVLHKSSKFNIIDQHSLEFFGVCKSCSKV